MDTQSYPERVYAGFLGMNIGIRLGAPIEAGFWTAKRIREVYGDIRGYVRDYKHFAADDDVNGPVLFARALDDTDGKEPTPQSVAEAWLNYAREGVGLYWWGGFGVSTEHTAYLNLKNGVPAPRSGSIEQNGRTLAEQIGGQIFIETWGLVAPGDPERAARYARAAASVSHDGEGLNGAAFIAGCVSAAFTESDIGAVMDAGLRLIPAESLYASVVNAVRAFYASNPDNWRACLNMLHADWGYDRYGGVCHIIPNAGVCALALCYGKGDFARTVEIATMCGWDTDCNAGNVGAILGVLGGLEALPGHYRSPINDELVLSGISGYLNILDVPSYCRSLAAWSYVLRGERPPEGLRLPQGEIDFDFSLPGSTHGLRFETGLPCYSRDGAGVLLDRATRAGGGCKLYYKPFWRRADFSDERYMPVFSPTAYSRQVFEMTLAYEKWQGDDLQLTPYARETYSGREYRGEPRLVSKTDSAVTLRMTLPDADGGLFDELGVRIESAAAPKGALCGRLTPTRLRVYGAMSYSIDFTKARCEFGSVLPFSHNHGAWSLEGGRLCGMAIDHAESVTGNYYMRNTDVACTVTPQNGTSHLIGVRVQGARRGYYAGFCGEGRVAILKHGGGSLVELASAPYDWRHGQSYELRLTATGGELRLHINGVEAASAHDGDYAYGMAALALYGMGRCEFEHMSIETE